MPTCLRAYVPTCLRAYVPTCLRAYVPTCLRAYVPTCLRAYVPTCLRAYVPTCLCAYVQTYKSNIDNGRIFVGESLDVLDTHTSRRVDSRPRVDLDCHCRCAVVVCCHLANRLALTVSEKNVISLIALRISTNNTMAHWA